MIITILKDSRLDFIIRQSLHKVFKVFSFVLRVKLCVQVVANFLLLQRVSLMHN